MSDERATPPRTDGPRHTPRRLKRSVSAPLAVALAACAGGCTNWDSFLDPSVLGRWERTPTVVPILGRLAPIEDEEPDFVEVTEIRPEDLIPEAEAYRVGPGDALLIVVWDLVVRDQPEQLARIVDPTGYIEITGLGRIFVAGLTEAEVAAAIEQEAERLVANPLVSVVVEQRRQQQFHLFGNVPAPGPYFIPSSDYRILQALTAAGGFPSFVDEVFVIRQVPLTPAAAGRRPEREGDRPRLPQQDPETGEDLLDIIEELSGPDAAEQMREEQAQPADPPAGAPGEEPPEPLIELVDPARPRPAAAGREAPRPAAPDREEVRWVFLDGQWQRRTVRPSEPPVPAGPESPAAPTPLEERTDLVTQRVIRVPTAPLLAGDARYNIIVRADDIIRVPTGQAGNVYVDGEVLRPGVYTLPGVGRLTLRRLIAAAGGLSGLAIPERVDLTRVVGEDAQATIMLNLRAIAEGTQPDVYLKPDDHINVGTSFWALPLAVIRGGFRTSYGFGFLLDRNFGNDVFGPPPVSRNSFF